MGNSVSSSAPDVSVQRIRWWQLGRAVRRMLVAYPLGTDALVDQIRAANFFIRFIALNLLVPLHFVREQGWLISGSHGEMAAMMFLLRNERQGIRVMHVDDINVDPGYRRRGLAERLMRLAEDLAVQDQRPFLKLAVTVANTPAVALYRRLGYQEQHHQFLTFNPASVALPLPESTDLTLRPLGRRAAWQAHQQFYRLEMHADDPALGEMLVAYYPLGAGDGVPRSGVLRYALLLQGQAIGYADAYRRDTQWNLRLYLAPSFWGSESERQAIQLLTNVVTKIAGNGARSTLALHVPSSGHFDALCAGVNRMTSALDFTVASYERMLMVKTVAIAAEPSRG